MKLAGNSPLGVLNVQGCLKAGVIMGVQGE